jgi:hypothetical protein
MMNDKEYEICIKRIEKLEKRVEALLIIEKQNADLVEALEYLQSVAKSPYHRTPRTLIQMCSFFDDLVLPTIDKALAQVKGDQS